MGLAMLQVILTNVVPMALVAHVIQTLTRNGHPPLVRKTFVKLLNHRYLVKHPM